MTDNRYGDKPLGKSVEEVENEQGNRVNSPLPGEARRERQDQADFIPAVVGGGGGGTGGTSALVNPAPLTEDGGSPGWAEESQVDTPRPDRDRGTSES